MTYNPNLINYFQKNMMFTILCAMYFMARLATDNGIHMRYSCCMSVCICPIVFVSLYGIIERLYLCYITQKKRLLTTKMDL